MSSDEAVKFTKLIRTYFDVKKNKYNYDPCKFYSNSFL